MLSGTRGSTRFARPLLAASLALLAPAEAAAACCLFPRAESAAAAHASTHHHLPGATFDGLAATSDAHGAPCLVSAPSPALRERCDSSARAAGPPAILDPEPGSPSTPRAFAPHDPRAPARPLFPPLRL